MLMTATAVELLARPPESADPVIGLAPDTAEFVSDTDTLTTMCSCSASSAQPY
jgi:hypothetical protein